MKIKNFQIFVTENRTSYVIHNNKKKHFREVKENAF